MREIEIKCRLQNKNEVVSRLTKMGVKFGKKIKQHDVVYGAPGAQDGALDANWLRIRKEDDKDVYFTLKRSVVGHLDSIEHETKVDDSYQIEQIVRELGFELYSDLTKIRQKGKLGEIEICIDDLPSLGTFIEAEKIMEQDADHQKVVGELWEVFTSLGIKSEDEVHEGYDVLERRLKGL